MRHREVLNSAAGLGKLRGSWEDFLSSNFSVPPPLIFFYLFIFIFCFFFPFSSGATVQGSKLPLLISLFPLRSLPEIVKRRLMKLVLMMMLMMIVTKAESD